MAEAAEEMVFDESPSMRWSSSKWSISWLTRYRAADLPADLLAGTVVAIMLVPQAMAYSLLAGLPPQVGLYAAASAALVYPLIGSSRYLAVGPVAIVSLLVAHAIGALSPSGAAQYAAYAVQLAALVGVLQIALGAARLGFLANFVSHAVITGFTTAAALVIGVSQLKLILGVSVPRDLSFFQQLRALAGQIPQAIPETVILGLGSIATLVFFGFALADLLRRSPLPESWIVPITKSAPLVVVVLGSLAVSALGLDGQAGVATIGQIPSGLPTPLLPTFSLATATALLPTALAITFVGFAESYAVAKTLASKRREKVSTNRELVALGTANLAASVVGGYPVTGGFSRSVVNFSAGARTGAASMASGGLLIVTLAFFTPLFRDLPHAVLAAIIIVAVATLVDFRSLRDLWNYSRADGAAYLSTFVAVLLFGVEAGILLGVAVSIALHLWQTSRPHFAVVGRIAGTEHYRNVRCNHVEVVPHLLAIRVDESLYFANTAFLEEHILDMVSKRFEIRDLVLITSAVNFIDGSALETLETLVDELRDAGVTLHLAEVKGPVMDRLERAGFPQRLAPGKIFLTTHRAVLALRSKPAPSGVESSAEA